MQLDMDTKFSKKGEIVPEDGVRKSKGLTRC